MSQKAGAGNLRRLGRKTFDKRVADPPPLLLRFGHPPQRRQELLLRLDHVQVGLEVAGELPNHRLLLVLP